MVDLLARSWVEIVFLLLYHGVVNSRPPCEVVSWNESQGNSSSLFTAVDLLARSWVEIVKKNTPQLAMIVDLLARSWVEICMFGLLALTGKSRPPCEVVSWNNLIIQTDAQLTLVDLLARSWVEMAVLSMAPHLLPRRPPREVVSWNNFIGSILPQVYVDLFVRSWVEIQNDTPFIVGVSSTSSWGRELK